MRHLREWTDIFSPRLLVTWPESRLLLAVRDSAVNYIKLKRER